MKITMIGDTMVGKTTFMMSTYGLMQGENVTGFSLKCKDEGAHNRLIRAYNDFRAIGKYPPATVQMDEYEYDFYNGNDWVMKYSLVDIRGESIHDYDVNALLRQLKDSQAMILFLNGYDIVNGEDVSDQIDDIYMLMNNSFITSQKQKLIMVIFSQCDRIADFGEETLKRLMEPVEELKTMADKSNNVNFVAVPTACSLDCMMDLDYAMAGLMYFGYTTDLIERHNYIEAELESIKRQYGDGLFRGILDFLGLDYERDAARARASVLQGQIDEFNAMVPKFEKLKKFVDDYELGTHYRIKRLYSSAAANENAWGI